MPAVSAVSRDAKAARPHLSVLESFSKHRRYNVPICQNLAMDSETVQVAKDIGNCALRLGVEVECPTNEVPEAKLRAVRACRRRLCPFCEWRRTKAWRRRFFEGLPRFHEAHPTHKPIFLTLTVKNCHISELNTTIRDMHRAWNRMVQCSFFPTKYWFRKTEVTVSPASSPKGPVSNAVHPHIHVLLLVPASYFSHGYVRKSEWQKQWMMAARLDYSPITDVRVGNAKSTSGGSASNDILSSALEVSKYATKATDLLSLGPILSDYHHQMKGARLTGVSSGLRPYVSASEISEEELTDGGSSVPVESFKGTADWHQDIEEYLFSDIN